MPIQVKCTCGCKLKVPGKYASKKIRCPKCKTAIQVPDADVQPSSLVGDSNNELSQIHIDTGGVSVDPVIEDDVHIEVSTRVNVDFSPSEKLLAQIERSRSDRNLAAWFIACLILVVGLANLVPAIYHWHVWSKDTLNVVFPKWIFMLIFIAALHLLYSLFAFQISDWSALRAVAIVVLIFAAVFVFVFSELLLGKSESKVADYINLPDTMRKTAIVWTAVMLLMELTTCYLAARESFVWQRIEKLSSKLVHETVGNPT